MLYYRHNLAKAKITIIEKDNLQLNMQQDLLLKTNENLALQKGGGEIHALPKALSHKQRHPQEIGP